MVRICVVWVLFISCFANSIPLYAFAAFDVFYLLRMCIVVDGNMMWSLDLCASEVG